jgi:hypothetical protein
MHLLEVLEQGLIDSLQSRERIPSIYRAKCGRWKQNSFNDCLGENYSKLYRTLLFILASLVDANICRPGAAF